MKESHWRVEFHGGFEGGRLKMHIECKYFPIIIVSLRYILYILHFIYFCFEFDTPTERRGLILYEPQSVSSREY